MRKVDFYSIKIRRNLIFSVFCKPDGENYHLYFIEYITSWICGTCTSVYCVAMTTQLQAHEEMKPLTPIKERTCTYSPERASVITISISLFQHQCIHTCSSANFPDLPCFIFMIRTVNTKGFAELHDCIVLTELNRWLGAIKFLRISSIGWSFSFI